MVSGLGQGIHRGRHWVALWTCRRLFGGIYFEFFYLDWSRGLTILLILLASRFGLSGFSGNFT